MEKIIFKNEELSNYQGNFDTKSMPFNADAESSVLSAFLLDNFLFEQYISTVNKDDFYIDYNRNIFQSMVDVYKINSFLDLVIIKDHLIKFHFFDSFIAEYLQKLSENIFSMGLINKYIFLLKEKSNLRKIIRSANSIISQCYDSNIQSSSVIVDNAEKIFLEIASNQQNTSYSHLDKSIKNVFSIIANSAHNAQGMTGISTGFKKLDEMTCGFQPGDLIILAARPSMGKSAFALCLARNSVLTGNAVGFVSLEMSSEQLAMRILSLDAKVPLNSLRSGRIDSENWMLLTESAPRISDYPIYIDDTPGQAIFDVKTRARKLFLEKGIKMLIVDYLQLLHINKKFESRYQEVSEISRALKQIAKELNIPVIALSQLSRGVDSRTDKRPLLSDLRDSGAIEQDADMILFLYRDVVYNKTTLYPDIAELIVGKQRNGPTGVVNVRYAKDYTLFDDDCYDE